ncbi:hypothetical protein ACFLVV_01625 [Chloroflexota bacterium]
MSDQLIEILHHGPPPLQNVIATLEKEVPLGRNWNSIVLNYSSGKADMVNVAIQYR